MEIILLLAGAILGVGSQQAYEIIHRKWSDRKSTQNANDHTVRAAFTPRFNLPSAPAGFKQATTHGGHPLPILESDSTQSATQLRPEESSPLIFVPSASVFNEQGNGLERFERITGRKLHNGTCCYVAGEATSLLNSSFEVNAGKFGEYLNYYIPALKKRGNQHSNSAGQWNAWAQDFLERSMNGDLRLQVGCAMALVQKVDGVWSLLQHRRSSSVAITPGLITTTPVFGVEPSSRLAHTSKLGLLQYNMLREVGEEIFSIPELDSAAMTRRFDPDWILSCIPVKEFYDKWVDGSIDVRIFAVVINLVTANAQVLVAAIDDQDGWTEYLRTADANWEVEGEDDAPSLRFRPVGELTAHWEAGSDDVSAPAVLLDSKLYSYLAST